jgi:uncharacterized protein (TIGR03437 family)
MPAPASAALALNSDGTLVYDTVNNITWLANANLPASNQFGLPPCNGSGSGTKICVNASGSMNYQAAAAWVVAMNAANYLGHSDWQLPTTPLIDKTCPKVGPNGGSFGFGCTAGALDSLYNGLGLKAPNTAVAIPGNTVGPFSNVQPYLYWSQTNGGQEGNLTFSFATGWQGANTLPNFLYAWPMIPGKITGTPPASGNVLQINADKQTVYDPLTNITWLANANLAASNTLGLPACKDPTTPTTCVAQDGAMTYDSAVQFIANMNSAAYLGQKNWQLASIDQSCPGYNCQGTSNPMGNLFYAQLGVSEGASAVVVPNISVGAVHNIQPYLYWTCGGATIQSPCTTDQPAPNFEWSYSLGSGFQGTDLLANNLYVTAYFVGTPDSKSPPVLTSGSVANGATYLAGGLVPGSWAQVKSLSLATTAHIGWTDSDYAGLGNSLPTNLNGTTVQVNGLQAAVYAIIPTQVDFQVPAGVSGNASVQVFVNGAPSNMVTAAAANNSPGIFPCAANGTNYPCAYFPDGKFVGDPSVASVYRKAKAGDVVQMCGTGLTPSPAGVRVTQQTISGVNVTIGAITVPADAAVLVYPGEFQVNFTVPQQFASMAEGNYPLTITVNGVTSPTSISSNPPAPVVLPIQH